MTRLLTYIFIILTIATTIGYAVTGDFDSDGNIDANDVNVFNSYWLGTPVQDPNADFNEDGNVDFVDFALMAANYVGGLYVNTAPTASNVTETAYSAESTRIDFDASDDNGDALQYIITSKPSHGTLTDVSVGAGFVNSTPHTIKSSHIDCISYKSDSDYTGEDSFNYKVSDGLEESDEATVTVTVSAQSLDCIEFDGQGEVNIPDSVYVDFNDTFTLAVWVKTSWPYGEILSDRGTSGAGFALRIVDGIPTAFFYDTNGKEKTIRSSDSAEYVQRIDTGEWTHIAVVRDSNVVIYVDASFVGYVNQVLPTVKLSNTSNLKIGKKFKGCIDRISWYGAALSNFEVGCAYALEGRNGDDGGLFVPVYATRFNFNEGTGTAIGDMTHDITGNIVDSNHVKWRVATTIPSKPSQKIRSRERYRIETFHFRPYRGQNN